MYKIWKDLIRPKKLEVDKETLTGRYGKFVARPLERGYGVTLVNSLRRVLISSLSGAAITSVRIDGVLHEFSSITDVRDDVTDLILNLKEVRLRLNSDEPRVIKIHCEGPKVVTAKDFDTDELVEILNPEQHLSTLSKGAQFKLEAVVKRGRGFVPAELNKAADDPVGTIAIDSLFSPVRMVKYEVTNEIGRASC